VLDDKVSVRAAEETYGVVLDAVGRSVDWAATAAVRRLRNA
jgi:hypothetical protein